MPHGEPPDPWTEKDVLDQVEEALDELDVKSGPARDALISGVRAALEGIQPWDGEPPVRVVDGGLDEDDPPVERERPDLRVAADVESDVDEDTTPLGGDGLRRVRVVRVGAEGGEGRILVVPGDWQTVFRGRSPRVYRIRCDRGAFRIEVDGDAMDEVQAGQSADVEGALLRVGPAGDEAAEGRYQVVRG
jgi:hypothetical protein